MKKTKKLAIVLFNLGGPNSLAAVQPFLFNLFYDKAIINLPNPLRWLVAKIIATSRTKTAKEIYQQIGGASPILKETIKQKQALQQVLETMLPYESKIFIAMRYWHPRSSEVIQELRQYQPDEIILLPLYPQFSTTTTGSSVTEWRQELLKGEIKVPIRTIGCYPIQQEFLNAHLELIHQSLASLKSTNYRIIFSAHGLPKKIIESGDPYQWQVEQTVAALVAQLAPNLDYIISYQSRVGPLEWIGPNTEDEIRRAIAEQKAIVIVPIAFVSEHSETLVELDIEYRHIADLAGTEYIRVPALSDNRLYIAALAKMVADVGGNSLKQNLCPKEFTKCICRFE